ncbi:MAG: alpha/beta hydrolase [Chloroflexota bacterium]|nr:alpha/beta hydrolase [Chloroflexota bacterium]
MSFELNRKHLFMLEMPRALLEYASLFVASPALMYAPKGDGHPVLVMPGLTMSDEDTYALRTFLRWKGYAVSGWGMGKNMGLQNLGGLEVLLEKLDNVYQQNDRQKVTLVGWSLGGIFARRMARNRPDKVRQVISMGSPIVNPMQTEGKTMYDRFNDAVASRREVEEYLLENKEPLPVPSTAIFSRSDGVVQSHLAQEEESAQTENIEVVGSHTGLAVNPQVLYAVAKTLAAP